MWTKDQIIHFSTFLLWLLLTMILISTCLQPNIGLLWLGLFGSLLGTVGLYLAIMLGVTALYEYWYERD